MINDPIKTFYLLGYADAKDKTRKRNRRVPYNFKLAYVSGRHDAVCNKPSRYEMALK